MKIIRNENQILTWEKRYNDIMEESEEELYSTRKQLRFQIVSSDLDFSQKQRERITLLVSKIEDQSAEWNNDEK